MNFASDGPLGFSRRLDPRFVNDEGSHEAAQFWVFFNPKPRGNIRKELFTGSFIDAEKIVVAHEALSMLVASCSTSALSFGGV